MITAGRIDIFLESLAMYAQHPRGRRLLYRHPLFVISDLWRRSAAVAKRRRDANRFAAMLLRVTRTLSPEFIAEINRRADLWIAGVEDAVSAWDARPGT